MDRVSSYTREQVIGEAKRWVEESSVQGIMALLDQYDGSAGGGRERVQMAMLKLSQGTLHDLRHDLQQANMDFRDVLSWAEYDSDKPR